MTSLDREFAYYRAHQPEFVEQFPGKVLVIKGNEVLGAFDDELEALEEARKKHRPGTFLVQRVSPGESDVAHTFHSRVTFS